MSHIQKHVKITKNQFENAFWSTHSTLVGVDEVGRGCLAGPLVTAAVILPLNANYDLLKDSKKLSEQQRNEAYQWIIANCQYHYGIVHHRIIDQHNIYQATLIAMKRAVVSLLSRAKKLPVAVLVDAMPLELSKTHYQNIPVYHFIKGEDRSTSIAAASIVAKVMRDALMQKYDRIFPGYHFAQHKGYSTKTHTQSIIHQGHSIIHRETFLGAISADRKLDDTTKQQSLC